MTDKEFLAKMKLLLPRFSLVGTESLRAILKDVISLVNSKILSPIYDTVTAEKIIRPERSDVNFVFQGDSRSAKLAPNGVPVETQYPSLGVPYPNQLMLMPNFKDRGNYINTNQFGTDVDGVIGSYSTKVYPYRPNGTSIKESYLFLEIGVNNCTSTSNVNTIIEKANNIVEYAKQAEADGFKVCLTCILFAEAQSYSDGVDVEANRLAFNKVLKSRASEIYMVIDMDHLFGPYTDKSLWAETTTNSPVLHLNGRGNYLRASYINSLFNVGVYSNILEQSYIKPLESTNYKVVYGNGSPLDNGKELALAITLGKNMSPTSTDRFQVIVSPGKYDMGSAVIELSTGYVDIVSLTGNRDVEIITTNDFAVKVTSNSYLKGIKTSKKIGTEAVMGSVYENCEGGNSSFCNSVGTPIVSGTFINCKGGSGSFGYLQNASGIFKECEGGINSFGTGAIADGEFINCTSSRPGVYNMGYCFGALGTASGFFIGCRTSRVDEAIGISGGWSFGGNGGANDDVVAYATGTFIDCIGGDFSFGTDNVGTGRFIRCIGGAKSFGYLGLGMSSTKYNYCIGGDYSFNNGNNSSCTYKHCSAGINSFGDDFYGVAMYCDCVSGGFTEANGTYLYCVVNGAVL